MTFFVFDIETLGTESTSVVLSATLLYVNPDELSDDNDFAYQQMLDEGCFVKFNSAAQTKDKLRSWDKPTLEWWRKQSNHAQAVSLLPSEIDVSPVDGLTTLREYYMSKPNAKKLPVWTRGQMDQLVFESLMRSFGFTEFIRYNSYRDVRTAIDILYPLSAAGYIDIDNFDKGKVIKHDPTHDCAYDALQLLRGKQD